MMPKKFKWIKPGVAVDYKSSPFDIYAGKIGVEEPYLLGKSTWVVDLVEMDDLYFAMMNRRTVRAVACDAIVPAGNALRLRA